ncbi:prepilin-type N-terminal cleavage/methylation domain-containing protein [Desulfonispora thiosulfatigenes DSM 11270]|uniref:Prepilin-type N-terminal cleavage/methylation domain-containing protein n=1 Tax=Desulfonispora thiosulfatigenes DSM 11270 TaxID=656914 RepID=A0A1W1VP74_DESTI|nr:prepilin-type N-terminal cleavage/methylation domain-containing protein [Desulfonispora thiosulfatigenes]SMB94724.1 prepilin-type N-terminal cleavage/methylation domain-containing protein [Desulfonispora thiosulfatigenes DSM 11270]
MGFISKSVLKRQDGFTFLELMIVIIIIGLITSQVSLNVSKLIANYKLKSIAHELISDLRYAQETSITQEGKTKIIFSKDVRKTRLSGYYVQSVKNKNFITDKLIKFPQDIKMDYAKFGNYGQILFISNGKPKANGKVILKNQYGEELYVYVYNRGRFRISTI